jgi:hypothetical protein
MPTTRQMSFGHRVPGQRAPNPAQRLLSKLEASSLGLGSIENIHGTHAIPPLPAMRGY